MTDTEPDLAAIRARCDAATPGPWEYVEDNEIVVAGLQRHSPGHISYDTLIVEVDGGEPGLDETEAAYDARVEANTRFVVAARADLPALLDLVERQAAEIERLRTELGRAQRAVRAFPTPIEVLAVDRGAGTASVIVVGWHLTRPVEIPLGPIVTATGIAADDLPGRWLEADVNCYAAQAADLVIRRIVIAPDLPPELMTRDASRAPESPADAAPSNSPRTT